MIQLYPRQVLELARASLKARYRSASAGFFWVVLNPLLIFGVQGYVFSLVLHVNIERFSLFLMAGLFPWIFITQSLEMCVASLVNAGPLLKSFPVHPAAIVLAQILDNAFNFMLAFFMVLLPIVLYHNHWGPSLLLLPVCIVFLVLGVVGLAWFLACLNVFLRDTRYLVSFGLSIGFFLTPIFYHPNFVPEAYRWVLHCNPLYYWIRPFQVVVHDFHWTEFAASIEYSFITGLVFFGLGSWFWMVKRNGIYNHL